MGLVVLIMLNSTLRIYQASASVLLGEVVAFAHLGEEYDGGGEGGKLKSLLNRGELTLRSDPCLVSACAPAEVFTVVSLGTRKP